VKRLDGAFADGLAGNEQFVSGALGEPLGAAPAPRVAAQPPPAAPPSMMRCCKLRSGRPHLLLYYDNLTALGPHRFVSASGEEQDITCLVDHGPSPSVGCYSSCR
jgi:hypothetical protein